MSTATTYNGWTNYETWLVKLWIDNDEGDCEHWREVTAEVCREARPDRAFTRQERATLDLSDRLKSEYEEAKDTLLEESKMSASLWADLLGGALSEVNWHEIAENLIDEHGDDPDLTEQRQS